jgi:hypothetical protein
MKLRWQVTNDPEVRRYLESEAACAVAKVGEVALAYLWHLCLTKQGARKKRGL